MPLAPVVLFAYSRPDHLRRTVESLLQNQLAGDSDLIVFSDAAKTWEAEGAVDEVRTYLEGLRGFRSVSINLRSENYGLSKSIITGVSEVLQETDRLIVLEDDMLTSPYFLRYMNEGLERFGNDDRVASIHGYVYPVDERLPEAFFLQGADCWGWATTRRGWECFDADGRRLLAELKRRKLEREFDFNGSYAYTRMLAGQVAGQNDSWAVRWYASAFLANKLTLYPGRSLVHNIGNDSSGTHCGIAKNFDAELTQTPIDLSGIDVRESTSARSTIEGFFRLQGGSSKFASRVFRKMRSLQRRP
jgi:glycosyltransferase involved in cell wall biosynthesis